MAGKQDTIDRLIEQRDLLRDALLSASPTTIGRISSEYRNTILEIDRLEREASAGNSSLARLIGSLSSGANSKD